MFHLTDQQVPIVFVHLGKAPLYLHKNLKYFATQFQDLPKILITDNEKLTNYFQLGYYIVELRDLDISWPPDFEVLGKKREFRNNFWFATKARLVILPRFMSIFKLQKIIHVESDVWVHPNFPFEKLSDVDAALAFPRVDKVRGIASILLINGSRGIELLSRSCSIWPQMTDMEILGRLLDSSHEVFELPSTFNVERNEFFDWIFDGAKLGMYLFGSDPRNHAGVLKRFKKSPLGDLPGEQEIDIEKKQIILKIGAQSRKVANLHLHSKNRKMFSDNWTTILKRQIRKEALGLNYGFDISAFVYWFLEKCAQIYRKLKNIISKFLRKFIT